MIAPILALRIFDGPRWGWYGRGVDGLEGGTLFGIGRRVKGCAVTGVGCWRLVLVALVAGVRI